MTSETDALQTNEFLRRRKLRLQQVREQSKDIAKKIRQRAKVEKLRHVTEVDSKKEKDYLQQQEKLVRRLEHLYSQGIQNIGAGHQNASDLNQQEIPVKLDLSKLRGREAVAELRRKKQEKLDEQKKVLDRKLQAREAANEISREKSTAIANILKSTANDLEEKQHEKSSTANDLAAKEVIQDKTDVQTRNDMGTQWESDELPNEWIPNIPTLPIPKDDSAKNSDLEQTEKSKRFNLFALSDEMPSSLRGGLTTVPEETEPLKPSLSLISQYLQNRSLRLREPSADGNNKKQAEDLQRIKQTILRTRASKASVSGNSTEKSSKSAPDSSLAKKSSVTIYNHSTRNSRDMPCRDEQLVVRDETTSEDAYSQAVKESVTNATDRKERLKANQEKRNKIAVAKQTVDKEYRDTLAFLNSLPKEKPNKTIKTAYMDDRRQQLHEENKQRKLQSEFKKIEKECSKRTCKHGKSKLLDNKRHSKSTSSVNVANSLEDEQFQYSWMPVPDGDSGLAIHTIHNTPNTPKEKAGNTVKFSDVDSYHEYRSRHKHTPPTKDKPCNPNNDKQANKRVVEAVIIQQNDDTESSSIASDTSSISNIKLGERRTKNTADKPTFSDAEKIIIYKILQSKDSKNKNRSKLTDKVARSMIEINNNKSDSINGSQVQKQDNLCDNPVRKGVSFEQLNEGVYKAVGGDGDNIGSMSILENGQEGEITLSNDEVRFGRTCCCGKIPTEQGDKGINIYKGRDVDSSPRSAKSCGAKCACAKSSKPVNPPQTPIHTSAATSASSFQTAYNDKGKNYITDPNFINLINEVGPATSKLYIGASGFLKDDAYEVIIQLKKKETEKENSKTQNEILDKSSASVKDPNLSGKIPDQQEKVVQSTIIPNVDEENLHNLQEASQPHSFDKVVEVDININHSNTNSTNIPKTNNIQKEQSVNDNIPHKIVNVCDKAVHTSFEDAYTTQSYIPKSDSFPRPATSTYTQTSIHSPNTRPVFMHMSSSTSTVYLSPPDMILPRFLRPGYSLNGDETYESVSNNPLDPQYEVVDKERRRNPKECRCKKCMRSGKSMRKNSDSRSTYSEKRGYNYTDTPPNTARSLSSSLICKNVCKCRKCDNRDKHSCKSHRHKRNVAANNLDVKKQDVAASSPSKIKIKSQTTKRYGKSGLNPIIKEYVHKLLALNKEGLKAMEVVNQECSSVATPSSSVIDVACNKNCNKSNIENKISLEQIKNILTRQILNDQKKKPRNSNNSSFRHSESQTEKCNKLFPRLQKKKPVHKIKSLNISRRVSRSKKINQPQSLSNIKLNCNIASSSSSTKENTNNHEEFANYRSKSRSKRTIKKNDDYKTIKSNYVEVDCKNSNTRRLDSNKQVNHSNANYLFSSEINRNLSEPYPLPNNRPTVISSDSDVINFTSKSNSIPQIPLNTSTQTNEAKNSEVNFMKLAENKLQNMEKIADLTEKCTQRLSNLAKVLEEVRKNKSLAYSQISTSDTTSDSDHKSDKNVAVNTSQCHDLNIEAQKNDTSLSTSDQEKENLSPTADFQPFLLDLPKTDMFKSPSPNYLSSLSDKSSLTTSDNIHLKIRGRPPPALSRINLKNMEDVHVIPHELSTVLEVDSPMSVKLKNQSSQDNPESKPTIPVDANVIDKNDHIDFGAQIPEKSRNHVDPDLLRSNINVSKRVSKVSSASSDDTKLQMMDLKQFNDIMLTPFITIQEYAMQCNEPLDEGSNIEEILKDDPANDDLSSLHSDGSLPDVIAELLKRNVITEPFKFDTGSNVNSTTISSESTISLLALSKIRKEKKKSSVIFKNKENMAETSETLSVSSNPDLENAFQKLGMGWASSTLKKTKERLALSSSSNTSSSSLTQFKIKSFHQDVPALGTDSIPSPMSISKKDEKTPLQSKNISDSFKNAIQQTSLTNSMTVKEFLKNELAKKLSFSNKSNRNGDEEFVSLYETKMPDEMKISTRLIKDSEQSVDSVPSGNNNRARTSTPVQIFRSSIYHSSSGSNTSNGLFSNADELSSVKGTSNSIRNHSTSDKDDLTIPDYSLKMRKGVSDYSKSE